MDGGELGSSIAPSRQKPTVTQSVTLLMKLHPFLASTLALGSLTAIGLSAAQEATDGFSYRLPGRGWLRMAGACNADPEQVTCWKPTGEPDAKLSELINAYFLVNSQQRLEIRYKHRSLMLVMKSLINNSSGQGTINFNGLEVDPGGTLNQQGNIGYNGQGEESTTFYWFYPSEGVTSVDVSSVLNESSAGVRLALKTDAEAKLPGGSVRIGKIEKLSDKDLTQQQFGNPNAPKGPHWSAVYTLSKEGPEPLTSIYGYPYDTDGNQINQVDKNGNPTAPRPSGLPYNNGFMSYNPLVIMNGTSITLAVNPEKVGYLMITGNTQRKVAFKNVALAPKN